MSSTSGDQESTSTLENKGKLSNHFGMAVPYNFSIAIPAILTFFLMAVVALMAIGMALTDRLNFGTPRSYFFIYLAALITLSLLLIRKTKVAWFLITVIFIEVFLAFVPYYVSKVGLNLNSNLLPAATNSRFTYHPLLQGIPKPNHQGTLPDGGVLSHTSFGTRGPEPKADILKTSTIINTFGGSTTYDVAVSDESTWSHQLEKLLTSNVAVINRGVPAYTSADNLIQTMFYDQVAGRSPTCSIYYEGWNDARNAHIPTPDSAYADTHVLSLVNELQVRKGSGFTPLMTLVSQLPLIGQDTVPLPTNYPNIELSGDNDQTLEERFRKNIQSIVSVNNAKGVKSIFIGQILNSEVLVGDNAGLIPNVPMGQVMSFITNLNSIMKIEAEKLGAVYIDAGQAQFKTEDFVDEGHFSASGSAKFARQIAPTIQTVCLPAN